MSIPPGAYQSPFYQPAHIPPPRDNSGRNRILIIGGVVFAALIVIGTIATALNPTELRQALATPSATRSAVAKVTPAPSRHHAGRHKPSKAVRAAKRIITWYTGAGGRELHAVDAQLAAMVRAGRSGNFAAEGRACGRLATVVGDAQAAPAIPDARAGRYYAMALSQYEVAATECQDGVASQDAATIERAAGHAMRAPGISAAWPSGSMRSPMQCRDFGENRLPARCCWRPRVRPGLAA
jgi:hypothetical protein